MNKTDVKALYHSKTYCHKTGTRPPSLNSPWEPTIHQYKDYWPAQKVAYWEVTVQNLPWQTQWQRRWGCTQWYREIGMELHLPEVDSWCCAFDGTNLSGDLCRTGWWRSQLSSFHLRIIVCSIRTVFLSFFEEPFAKRKWLKEPLCTLKKIRWLNTNNPNKFLLCAQKIKLKYWFNYWHTSCK